MGRPSRDDRTSIAAATLTLRLTQEDRELLGQLVALQASELRGEGMVPTAASFVRGLIRREAAAKGFTARTKRAGRSTDEASVAASSKGGALAPPKRSRRS